MLLSSEGDPLPSVPCCLLSLACSLFLSSFAFFASPPAVSATSPECIVRLCLPFTHDMQLSICLTSVGSPWSGTALSTHEEYGRIQATSFTMAGDNK